jgi:hypothetical protein
MKKYAFTKARLDVFIFASLLPLLILGCGILGLIAHLCFNKAFAITYLIFPLATVALLAVCMFSGMRRAWKIGLSVLILLVFALLFLGGVLFGRHHGTLSRNPPRSDEMRVLIPVLTDVINRKQDIQSRMSCFWWLEQIRKKYFDSIDGHNGNVDGHHDGSDHCCDNEYNFFLCMLWGERDRFLKTAP